MGKATRGIDGRIFVGGMRPPKDMDGWSLKAFTRADATVSPFGCFALTDTYWQWTSSRSEIDSIRFIVKGGMGRGAVSDRKPARRRPMDPKAKYHSVGVIFVKDVAGSK
jgi:hypothetical protein